MNNKVQEIHRERLRYLMVESEFVQDDIGYCAKKVDHEMFSCYSDIGKEIARKPHEPSTLLMWVRECREKATELVNFYQQIADELDDIEDEVNRDEVNSSGQ